MFSKRIVTIRISEIISQNAISTAPSNISEVKSSKHLKRKVESDYISFCGTHRPSIDFISTNETMRVFLKSNIKPTKVTGEERFLLKYR